MAIDKKIIDELLKDYENPKTPKPQNPEYLKIRNKAIVY